MVILLVFSVLFALGSVYNIYTGDLTGFISGLCLSAFILLVYFFFNNQKKRSNQFKQWLDENVCDIYSGKAVYNGRSINLGTKITQFQFCLSFIVFSIKIPSRYYLQDDAALIFYNLTYSLCTLIFGWWGLPWGPIYTLQVLFKNIFGGIKSTVKDLIPENELEFAQRVYENTQREVIANGG